MAEGGWVGIAIPEEYGGGGRGITEASVVLEEVAASGAAMNGCSRAAPVDLRDEPGRASTAPKRCAPSTCRGSRPASCTSPSASPSPTPAPTRPRSRRGRVRDGDHYIVRGRKVWTTKALVLPEGAAARAHDAARGVQAPHRRHDAAARRPAAARGRHPPDPQGRTQRRRVVRGALRRPARRGHRPRGGGGRGLPLPARRPQPRAHPRRRGGASASDAPRSAGPSPTRTTASCSTGPIGQNQGVAFPLAEAYARLHAAELAVHEAAARATTPGCRAVSRRTSPSGSPPTPAIRPLTRPCRPTAASATPVEYDVERYWREARLMRIAPISQELVLAYVAEHVLGLPRSY